MLQSREQHIVCGAPVFHRAIAQSGELGPGTRVAIPQQPVDEAGAKALSLETHG